MSISPEMIKAEYEEVAAKVKQYEAHFEEMLKEAIAKCGLDGDVVDKQSGKVGRLLVVKRRYPNRKMPYEVAFHPLKRDGTVAVNRSGFFYLDENYDKIEERLNECFEKVIS